MRKHCPTFCKLFPTFTQQGSAPTVSLIIFSLLVLGTFFTVYQVQKQQEIRGRAQVLSPALPPFSPQEASDLIADNEKLLQAIGAPTAVLSSCPSVPVDETIEKPNPARIQELSPLVSPVTIGTIQSADGFSRSPQEFKQNLSDQLGKFLSVRKPLFMELMRKDPNAALAFVIPQSILQTLPAISSLPANCAETFTTLEGTLEILHADFFEDKVSVNTYTLVTQDNKRIKLHPAISPEKLFISGMQLKINGFKLDNNLLFDASNQNNLIILPPPKPLSSNPFIQEAYADHSDYHTKIKQDAQGAQKIAVLLVNFQDTQPQSIDRTKIIQKILPELNNYYRENSYNKISSLSGDIFPASGLYTIAMNKTCALEKLPGWPDELGDETVLMKTIQAADSDIDFRNYNRLFIVLPCLAAAGGIGKWDIPTGDGVVRMSVAWFDPQSILVSRLTAHEFGHNLGLYHANFLNCGTYTRGGSCRVVAYGNPFDVMGGDYWHTNAFNKDYLGWFQNVVTPTTSGLFKIAPIEMNSSDPKTILLPNSLFVEYRQPLGYDGTVPSSYPVYQGGLFVQPGIGGTFLLDVTPTIPGSETDSTLKTASVFTDFTSGVTLTTIETTPTGLTLDIKFDTLDLLIHSLGVSPPKPLAGDIITFSATVENKGIGKIEIPTINRLRVDINNDGTWDVDPHTIVSNSPFQGGAIQTISWPTTDWVWLGNGNSSVIHSSSEWKPIGTIPQRAARFAFGLWVTYDDNIDILGNQGNYTMTFNDGTCVNDRSYENSIKKECIVITDLGSNILYDNNYPSSGNVINDYWLDKCDFRYTASTRLVEFRDTGDNMHCGYVVFWYGPLWSAIGGTHKFEVCADVPNIVVESSETNNCKNSIFTVPSSDLTIDSISFSPTSPPEGSSMSFSGVVKNIGTGNLTVNTKTTLRLDVKNNGTWDVGPIEVSTGNVGGNGTTTVAWTNAWTAIGGTHKIEVCADSPNEVFEPNETNNCTTQTFKTVTPPVLTPIGNKNVEATKQLAFTISASDPDDAAFTYQGQPLSYGPSLTFQINPLPSGATLRPLGDVTLDGKVDAGDALFINQYLGGTRTFTQTQKLLSDVTQDNVISKADVDEITKLTVVIPPPSIPNPTHMNRYLLIWTPTISQVGTYQPTFTVSDGLLTDTETITILVLPKPISYWKFDETSGNTAADSADANPGTLVNGPTWTTGKLQGAVNLDGINDYITIPSNSNLAMGTGSFTIAGWINLDIVCGPSWSNKICPIISTRNLNSTSMADGYWIGLALSHLWFQIGDGTANNDDFLVPFSFTNSWHHIAAVRDRSTNKFKLYIDGQLKGTDPDTLGDVGNSFAPYIGQAGARYFDGKMDDFRIYNRALSEVEIGVLAL